MKKIIQVLILFCFFSVNAQDTIIGEYYNYFGSELKLNPDSTFNYTFRFDMCSSWTNGRYKVKKHTIYFEFIPVYDTLRFDWDGGKFKSDTLVLSLN